MTVQLTATARDEDGGIIETDSETWSTSDASIATVSPTGVVEGHRGGIATITARIEGVEGITSATVQMRVTAVTISPAVDTVAAYDTVAFTAIATDVNGDPVPSAVFAWSTSNQSLAVVDTEGSVVTMASGNVKVRAAVSGKADTAALHITAARIVRIEIRESNFAPPDSLVPLRGTEQLVAFPFDAKGEILPGREIEWRSANPSALSVNDSGRVLAVGAGASSITATSEGIVSPPVEMGVVIMPPLISVDVADFHSCVVATDGAAYCWGNNYSGELGDGSTKGRDGPVLVAGGRTWTAITTGVAHTCGIEESGAAYCWGGNDYGELGIGSTVGSPIPVAVAGGHTFQSIAAGASDTCGVTTTHEAYCWGINNQGQLGTGNTVSSLTPVQVQGGHSFETISTSRVGFTYEAVTCAVTTANEGYCWGTNTDGQLGTGDSTSSTTPRLVAGAHLWAGLSAAMFHGCGLDTAGVAYCWGANPYGAFGNGTTASDPVPTPVDDGPYASVSAGYLFGCATSSLAELLCFGDNTSHQLGIIGPPQLESPTNPAPGLQFTTVRAGAYHACALSTAGQVYCWGAGATGETGVEPPSATYTPFKVVGQP